MINSLQFNSYFNTIANNLSLIDLFFSRIDNFIRMKREVNNNEVVLVMEPYSWQPKNYFEDNAMRKVNCAFTIWIAVADRKDESQRSTAEAQLMLVSDQIYAKIIQDYSDWSEDHDFIRAVAPDSFDNNFVEFTEAANFIGLRCDFELHTAPNFELDESLWNS